MKDVLFQKDHEQGTAELTAPVPVGIHKVNDGQGRIPYIDLMEAIAILFVVAYHLSNMRYKFLYDPSAASYVNYYLRCIFVSCVPLFLTANGFLLFRHSLDIKKHLQKTLRYVLLTLFWGVVTLALYNYVYDIPFGFRSFAEDLFTWRGGVIHLWYMGALVIIYLLFPLLKLMYDKNRILLLFFAGLIAVMSFGNQLLNHGLTLINAFRGISQPWVATYNWFSMFNPVAGIPGYTIVYFCLGAFLQDFLGYLKKFNRHKVNLLAAVGLAVFCGIHAGLFALLWRSIDFYYCPIWNGYETVTGFLITLCIIVLCANYRGTGAKFNRVVRSISSRTLGIYFLHMIVIYPIKERLMTVGALFNMPGNILCAAAVLVLCLLITAVLHRIPGLRKLVS